MKVDELLGEARRALQRAGSPTPRLDAEVLLSSVLGWERVRLFRDSLEEVPAGAASTFDDLLRRRLRHEPIAYLVGEQEFFGLVFHVSPSVLIPRPETELLVELVLAAAKATQNPKILDIGTGSGCIAIALAAQLGVAEVCGWDVSEQALAVAQRNADRHRVDLSLQCVDALDSRVWSPPEKPWDFLVSNPPYIGKAEAKHLPPSVVAFEPKHALFAASEGLGFYKRFAECAQWILRPAGEIFVEIGATQGPIVAELFRSRGWTRVRIEQDYAGLDRIVCASSPLAGE